MRLYDKIWVLMSEDEISELVKAMKDFFMTVPRKCITNKIVLSPEELREVWNDAIDGNQDFYTYLTSKGIILP